MATLGKFAKAENTSKFLRRYSVRTAPMDESREITDRLVSEWVRAATISLRVNYPNGDMVGHKAHQPHHRRGNGDLFGAASGCHGIQTGSGRRQTMATEEMYEIAKATGKPKLDEQGHPKAKTAHTLNPVWFIVHDPRAGASIHFNPEITSPGLANVAATCFQLLGLEPPAIYEPPLLLFSGE
jgi:2,3-bisphosphoglycerate-independent phosphoglycerate mutase